MGHLMLTGISHTHVTLLVDRVRCFASPHSVAWCIKEEFGGECILTYEPNSEMKNMDAVYVFTIPFEDKKLDDPKGYLKAIRRRLKRLVEKQNEEETITTD